MQRRVHAAAAAPLTQPASSVKLQRRALLVRRRGASHVTFLTHLMWNQEQIRIKVQTLYIKGLAASLNQTE